MPKRTRTLCALCDETSPVRMMTMYWAWTWPSGDRRCYKQHFDYECAAGVVQKVEKADNTDLCFMCGELAAMTSDINLYATYYIPGRDRLDAFLTIHEVCLTKGDQYFTQQATRMPERSQSDRAKANGVKGNPWDSWGVMGLTPS